MDKSNIVEEPEELEMLQRCVNLLVLLRERHNFYNSCLYALDLVLERADTRGDLSRTPYDLISNMRSRLFFDEQDFIIPLIESLTTFLSGDKNVDEEYDRSERNKEVANMISYFDAVEILFFAVNRRESFDAEAGFDALVDNIPVVLKKMKKATSTAH
jgi:hypothetical protein